MLFDTCVSVILSSLELVKQAAIHLPKNISHYILFEACRVHNIGAVQAIVSSWPHSEITFDFMSNGLCRRRRQLEPECIRAHEYFNVWYLDELAEYIPLIMTGLFNCIHLSQQRNCEPALNWIDLSKIRVIEYRQCKYIACSTNVTIYTCWLLLYIPAGWCYIYLLVVTIYTCWLVLYIPAGWCYIYLLVGAIYTCWLVLYIYLLVGAIYTCWLVLYIPAGWCYIYLLVGAIYTCWLVLYIPAGWCYIYLLVGAIYT